MLTNEQVTTGFSHHVSVYKKRILDEWWEILNKLTVPDKPIDIIKRTPNSLHFTYQVCILYHTTIPNIDRIFTGSDHRFTYRLQIPPKC